MLTFSTVGEAGDVTDQEQNSKIINVEVHDEPFCKNAKFSKMFKMIKFTGINPTMVQIKTAADQKKYTVIGKVDQHLQ